MTSETDQINEIDEINQINEIDQIDQVKVDITRTSRLFPSDFCQEKRFDPLPRYPGGNTDSMLCVGTHSKPRPTRLSDQF